jgi:phage tail-like protein
VSSNAHDPIADARDPIANARFRVEIDGMPGTGATEVIFPEAKIVPRRKRPGVQYGMLTIRRGMTGSSEWYDWWDAARKSPTRGRRTVGVVVVDAARAEVTRWTFAGARPSGYAVSPLNALGREPLIETLELSISGLQMTFAR